MTPEVKATKPCKIQSVLQDFPEEFMKLPSKIFIDICAALQFLATNTFKFASEHTRITSFVAQATWNGQNAY